MRYISTRGESIPVDFTTAMVNGLAPDGGLYIPDELPELPDGWRDWSYVEAVSSSLELFGAKGTRNLTKEAVSQFHHPDVAPVVEVGDRLVLELFHGPTLSFKDHALQIVARLLAIEAADGVVLGATSGDTGSAAIHAISETHLRIVMLFPEGRVSDFQRRQMTTVADRSVAAVAVRGTFDDCQRMVKSAFGSHPHLLAVNSINFARVAAQTGYHIYAAAAIGEPFDVVVPTGNFGNVYSAWLARQMGAPIETITVANNANHYLADIVNTGHAFPSKVIPTLAPAMDIQVPSNFERFGADPRASFEASWSDDNQIRSTITRVKDQYNYWLDPHTATAWAAGDEGMSPRKKLIVATAHPSKFDDGAAPPEWFQPIHQLEERFVTIDANGSELEHLIR